MSDFVDRAAASAPTHRSLLGSLDLGLRTLCFGRERHATADKIKSYADFKNSSNAIALNSRGDFIYVLLSGVLSKHDGRHGDGHPLRPLVWLANFLAARDEGLRAGQVITTGSYAGAIEVPMNERLTITFGDLGAVTVELVRK